MELQPVRPGCPLLTDEESSTGDLASSTPPAAPGAVDLHVDRPSMLEIGGVLAFITFSVALGIWLAIFVLKEIGTQDNSLNKLWLCFALMAPLTYFYNIVLRRAVLLYEQIYWVRAELDSMRGKTLYNAVALNIEEAAERSVETASADMMALTEYDKKLGRTSVKLSYWGSRPKAVHLRLSNAHLELRALRVDFERGGDVICGRDSSVQNREVLVLRLAASGNLLADKRLLAQWLHGCLMAYQTPAKDIVEIIALDESSKDWVPEWKIRCVRPMKRAEGVGQGFFLERRSALPLLADTCSWFGKELRCYLITAPPRHWEDGAYNLARGLPQTSVVQVIFERPSPHRSALRSVGFANNHEP